MRNIKRILSLVLAVVMTLVISQEVAYMEAATEIDGVYYLGSAVTGCREDVTTINILSSVNGTAITEVSDRAFKGRSLLEAITFEEGITSINREAFAGCISLTEVDLPDSLVYLTANVFAGCTALKEVSIPANVKYSKSDYANFGHWFENCTSLEKVTFEEGATVIPQYTFMGCKEIELVLPETIKTVEASAFANLDWIKNIDFLPESVTTIDVRAFQNCINMTSAILPEQLVNANNYIFYGCTSLKDVVMGDLVATLGGYAFENCTSLEEIVISKAISGANSGWDVGQHGKWFKGCTNLKKVTFAEGAEVVPREVFVECKEVEIVLPDTIKYISDNAFSGLTWLKNLDFLKEGILEIHKNAFVGCTSLTEVNLPESVWKIRSFAFANCTSLRKVTIPKNVVEIANGNEYDAKGQWFANCTSLEEIHYQDGATLVPTGVFSNIPTDFKVYLPDTVTRIYQAAFQNCSALSNITLPSRLERIDWNVFNGCTSLSSVYIPETVTFMADNTFSACADDLVLYCGNNPTAAASAAAADVYHSYSGVWNYNKLYKPSTYFYADGSTLLTGGYISLVAKYSVDLTNVQNPEQKRAEIEFVIPSDCRYIENSAYVNNTPVTNVSVSGNKLVMRDLPTTGTATVRVTKEGARDIISRAVISCNGVTETIGTCCQPVRNISVRTAPYTNDGNVVVSGIATPQTEVDLYINDTYIKTVTSNKAGTYHSELEISEPVQGESYEIKAVIGDNIDEAKKTSVRYEADMPILTDFKLYMNNHIKPGDFVDLLLPGKIATAEFWPVKNYVFKAQYTNPELIDKVYITSVKNNDRKTIEATFNKRTGLFETRNIFDPQNINYVPGDIEISYTLKEADVEANISKIIETDYSEAAKEIKVSNENTETVDGETSYTADITIPIDSGKTSTGQISYSHKNITDSEITKEIELEYEKYNNLYYRAEIMAECIKLSVIDITAKTIDSYALSDLGLGDISTYVGYLDSAYKFGQETYNYYNIRNQIYNSNNSNKEQMLKELDKNYNKLMMSRVFFVALSATAIAIAPSMIWAVALINFFGGVGIEAILKEMGMAPENERYRTLVNWLIDPSGYVYEAVTSNRVEGATVTVYYKDSETGDIVKWDAENYDQQNPLMTNAEGRYSWIVPEGEWMVECELDGYETVRTEWLPVPPPQMDVNIGLVSKAVPTVQSINASGNGLKITFSKYMLPETLNEIIITDSSENNIDYTVEYPTTETDADGNVLAREYTLTLNSELTTGDKINVLFNENIKSYAGVGMNNEIKAVTIAEAMPELKTEENIKIPIYGVRRIAVEATGYNENEIINAVSDVPGVISVESVSATAENGVFYVKLKANDFGTARITLTAESTGEEITIEASSFENENMPIVISDIASIENDTEVSFENMTEGSVSGKCILAVYDGNKLLKLLSKDFSSEEADFSISFKDYPISGNNYKIMVFDAFSQLVPMAYAY